MRYISILLLFLAFNCNAQKYLFSKRTSAQSYTPTYSSSSSIINIKVKSVKYYSRNRNYTYTYKAPNYMIHKNRYYFPRMTTYNLLIIKP